MAFSSLNGDIDVTFPADLKANVSLRSDTRRCLQRFRCEHATARIASPSSKTAAAMAANIKVKMDKTVRGTINGGGPEMQFTNFNGAIYIRKAAAPRQ